MKELLEKFKKNENFLLKLKFGCYININETEIILFNSYQRFIIKKNEINEEKLILIVKEFEKNNDKDFILLQRCIESLAKIKLVLEILDYKTWIKADDII